MSEANPDSDNGMASDLLAAILTSLPEDLPPELRGMIDAIALEGEIVLPPRLFHEAVEQMPVAISITDTKANILYINRAFEALTGYSSDEIVGSNESLLSNRRTPKSVYVELWTAITSGEVWKGRLINRRKDGSRYLADLTIVPVKTRGGEVSYFLGMHRDITEMHHLQSKVENQKNLIEHIIDSAPVVMALIDMKGQVITENRAYRMLAAEMGGEPPVETLLESVRTVFGDDLVSACAEERTLAGLEVRFEPVNGKAPRWFSCSGRWVLEFEVSADSYFETRKQNALLLVCNEITGLKKQYEKVRMNEVRARMAEAELGRRTSEFVEGALYQLQGPLNVMQAFADMNRRQEDGNHPMSAAIEEALASGRNATNALRHAMPMRTPPMQAPVNINQVIRDVLVISADRLSAAGVVVDWKPQSSLPYVYCSESALQILVRNLIDNAVTAVGEPGATGREVHIETRLTSDHMIEICIRDSGPGLDRAIQAKCFEPFYSAWRRSKGNAGMGLVIVKQILGELAGDIRIDAGKPTGTTVCVFLPSSKS